jgi:hypothetical protein
MGEYKNIEFQIKQYQMLEAKGELTEYAQGKLNGILEVMNIAKDNEVLGDVIWRCDEDVFDDDSIKVFTKGCEYTQIPTGLLWVIDDEGHKHDINKYKFTSI